MKLPRSAPGRRVALVVAALTVLAPGVQPIATGTGAASVRDDCAGVPWMDRSRSPERRARALLAASTLDQELRRLDEHSANDPARTTFTTATPRELPPGEYPVLSGLMAGAYSKGVGANDAEPVQAQNRARSPRNWMSRAMISLR
ncbi:hypothetical protein [Nonomuraea sp. NPDC049709]|uniref:hypothetical protein n=1 Tax=Nonomuraea sp. NPDC049709 TaxID=3154736 RepID=UPI00341D84F2